MSDRSGIEWTDATWNPVTGCTEVSPGCDNCYARTFAERWRGVPGHHFEHGFDVQLRPERLDQPLRWRKPRRIFVNSMSDLFHDAVPDSYIARMWAVMAATPQHTYQILTKRHGRMRSVLRSRCRCDRNHRHEPGRHFRAAVSSQAYDMGLDYRAVEDGPWPLPNVWLGVSIEDQKCADRRVPALLDTPAAVRWLSCEPLLGPVLLKDWVQPPCGCCFDLPGRACINEPGQMSVDWVVVGGESGPGARPMDPAWPRSLRDQCVDAGVPFLFKQWGAWRPASVVDKPERPCRYTDDPAPMVRVGKRAAGRVLDGQTWDQYPARTDAVEAIR